MDLIVYIIIAYFGYKIYDYTSYPNRFRGACGYCHKKHGRNQWHPKRLGKTYSYEKGFVFLSKRCFNSWKKKYIMCNSCDTVKRYSMNIVSHKYKRKYYYFCDTSCKNTFKNKHPKLFHEGYQRKNISSELRKIVWKRDNGQCAKCGGDNDLHYDHIIPVSKGGGTSIDNLEILCEECNLSKSNKIE